MGKDPCCWKKGAVVLDQRMHEAANQCFRAMVKAKISTSKAESCCRHIDSTDICVASAERLLRCIFELEGLDA